MVVSLSQEIRNLHLTGLPGGELGARERNGEEANYRLNISSSSVFLSIPNTSVSQEAGEHQDASPMCTILSCVPGWRADFQDEGPAPSEA